MDVLQGSAIPVVFCINRQFACHVLAAHTCVWWTAAVRSVDINCVVDVGGPWFEFAATVTARSVDISLFNDHWLV